MTIDILVDLFDHRPEYLEWILRAVRARRGRPGIVFLDPDTGLEPESGKFDHDHVCQSELSKIWKALGPSDLLVFYQHQDNRRNDEWKQRKRLQFVASLADDHVSEDDVKMSHAPGIARDVAFYFIQKS